MSTPSDKINLLSLLAITFLATSIVFFDFAHPTWSGNEKSYLGLVAAVVCWYWSKRPNR